MNPQVFDRTGFSIAVILLAIVVTAGVWDLIVLFSGRDGPATVSHYLSTWARQFPVGVMFIGIVIGHLIWQVPGVPRGGPTP